MILPNTLKLFCISTSLSEINDLEESIISSTPLNEKFNDTKALFESDTSERANTQSFNNLRIDSNNKTETKKKVKFMVNLLKKKKGRKGNEDAKREIHDSKTYDNIIRKIQTHFLNFIISFLDDCIRALNTGADDFIVKPYKIKELLARINAVNRRKNKPYIDKIYNKNNIEVNSDLHTIQYKDIKLQLRKKEFALFEMLFINLDNIIPRETIFSKIWEDKLDTNIESLDSHIYMLRKTLKMLPIIQIKLVKNVGYKMEIKK